MSTTITIIDRKTHRLIAERIEAALRPLGKELGVKIAMKGGQYSNGGFGTFKLEVGVLGDDGAVGSPDREELRHFCEFNGLDFEQVNGATINSGGAVFRLSGYKPNRPKFPFLAIRESDGREYKLTERAVRSAMGWSDKVII